VHGKKGDVKKEEKANEGETHEAGLVFHEGGDEEGLELRREKGIPDSEAARKKHFLDEEKRKQWEWEAGRAYGCDFYNPYLDFNDFALKLPGFTLPIMKYWDGQSLRYVLKNRKSDTVLFVVVFTLYLKEDVDEHGNLKSGVEGGRPFDQLPANVAQEYESAKDGDEVHHEQVESSEKKLPDTSEDDVD